MFGTLGLPELIFIFVLALLIFGPKGLPQVGRTLGRAMAEFRKASTDLRRTLNAELLDDEMRAADPRKIVRDSLADVKKSLDPIPPSRRNDAAPPADPPATAAPATETPTTETPTTETPTTETPTTRAPATAADEPSAAEATADPPAVEVTAAAGTVARGTALPDDGLIELSSPSDQTVSPASPSSGATSLKDPVS